jgi:hypothetical protein
MCYFKVMLSPIILLAKYHVYCVITLTMKGNTT